MRRADQTGPQPTGAGLARTDLADSELLGGPAGAGPVADVPPLVRVGIVVSVPDPLRTRLARWRRIFGDPLADAVPPHVTLLAPATVPAYALPEIEEHLRAVVAAEQVFGITLRGSGSFRPVSPVVYAALAAGRAACERLQARIRTGPLALPLRFPYFPHVTVAHGVTEPVLDAAEHLLADLSADFGVRTVDLYRAPPEAAVGGDGLPAAWTLQRQFPLGRPGALRSGALRSGAPRSSAQRSGVAGRVGALARTGAAAPRTRRDRPTGFLATGGGS